MSLQFISHKISISDSQVGTGGEIDAENEELVSVVFRNQGTSNVTVNNVLILSGTERGYQLQDENNLIGRFTYKFDNTGTNILVITRFKRVRSEIVTVNQCAANG